MWEALQTRQMGRKLRLVALLALVVSLVGCDQGMKFYAVENWKGQPAQDYLGGLFRIQYAENHGAFLSLLADAPEWVQFAALVVANGVLLIGVAVFLSWPTRQQALTFLTFALVLAGGIGNLIDRVRLGYVIDYYNIGIGNLRSGIFNVADMAITAGFLLLIPIMIRGDAPPVEQQTSEPVATA